MDGKHEAARRTMNNLMTKKKPLCCRIPLEGSTAETPIETHCREPQQRRTGETHCTADTLFRDPLERPIAEYHYRNPLCRPTA